MYDTLMVVFSAIGLMSHCYGCYLWVFRGDTDDAIMYVLMGIVLMWNIQ